MKSSLVSIAILFLLWNNSIAQTVPEEERKALITLFNATNGENWTKNTNWLSDSSVGTWYGVWVENGRITKLELNNNGLSGTIPNSISKLKKLKWLLLSFNQLSGIVPKELGKLSQLTFLRLDNNLFKGEIPRSFGNLLELQYLWINDNYLEGTIPESVSNLPNLTFFNLENNNLYTSRSATSKK